MEQQHKQNPSHLVKKHHNTPLISRSSKTIFSDDGKLLIKFKNPNTERVFLDGDPIEDKGNNKQTRACPECHKEFSSGKALGGHMRIHVQVKKTEYRSQSTTIDNKNHEKSTCSLCGKNFPSMKSLFGHMRCHPEREWRGIQPPAPAAKKSPSSSVSDDDQIDLMQSLPGWSVTGLRGRKATAPTSAPSSSEFDEKFHDAATGDLLLLIAQIDSIGSTISEKRIDEESEAINSNSNSNKAEFEYPNRVYRSNNRIIERRDSPVKMPGIDETETESPVSKKTWDQYTEWDSKSCSEDELNYYRYSESTNKIKKRKKMKLTVDLASFSPIKIDSADKYKCSTCNKCFPTHQALGGHRSSHNKFKISTINAIDEASFAAADQEDYQINGNPNCAMMTHQCKICEKTFSTGQALGGHKRCHWTGPVEAPSSQVTSAGEASQSQPGRRVLEFDLNEVPTMEDDDHAAGGAYDFAMSSYKSNIAY